MQRKEWTQEVCRTCRGVLVQGMGSITDFWTILSMNVGSGCASHYIFFHRYILLKKWGMQSILYDTNWIIEWNVDIKYSVPVRPTGNVLRSQCQIPGSKYDMSAVPEAYEGPELKPEHWDHHINRIRRLRHSLSSTSRIPAFPVHFI